MSLMKRNRCGCFLRKVDIWIYDRPVINKKIVIFRKSFDEVNKILNRK